MEQNEQEAVSQVYEYAAHLLVKEKKSPDEVINFLVEKGLDEESSRIIVDNLGVHIGDAKKKRAQKDMLYGALWCIGGIVVTAVTYSSASGGGRYVVAWGAIIFGAVQFFRGVSNAS